MKRRFTTALLATVLLNVLRAGAATPTAWVDEGLPAGATAHSNGGDSWNWVSNTPTPFSGSLAHQSNLIDGPHQHYFTGATAPLAIGAGDTLYAYVYLDPVHTPKEVMLQWNDGTSWEHRAYWGANDIPTGINGTTSRQYLGALPSAGQWVKLQVPARAVGLGGSNVTGMAFTLYSGLATWDVAGATTDSGNAVSIVATVPTANIGTSSNATLTFFRTGPVGSALNVQYSFGGNAVTWDDYRTPSGQMPDTITIPAGAAFATETIIAGGNETKVNPETASFTLLSNSAYTLGSANSATVTLLPATTNVVSVSATVTTANIGTSSNATLTFSRTGDTSTALPVQYSFGGTAGTWDDYRTPAGTMPDTVTIPAGASSITETILAGGNVNNANPEIALFTIMPKSSYSVDLSSSAGITLLPASAPASVAWGTVGTSASSSPTASVSLVATVPTATIGGSNGTLTFSRVGDTGSALTVQYSFGGNAGTWNDYRTPSGTMPDTVTIPAGATSVTETIIAAGNENKANPETAAFTILLNSVYSVGTPNSATITLLGAAAGTSGSATTSGTGLGSTGGSTSSNPVTVSVVATVPTAVIGGTNGTLTFSRTGGTSAALSLSYTFGGTAATWNDYRTPSGQMPATVIIPAGAVSVTETILAAANGSNANPETAIFTLLPSTDYSAGSANSATITLLPAANLTNTAGGTSGSGTGITGNPGNSGGFTGASSTQYALDAPAPAVADDVELGLPPVGSNTLHVLSPTFLELVLINTKAPDPASVSNWNFVDPSGHFNAPAISEFKVTVNGQQVAVQQVAFKRRPLYAPYSSTPDLRITNSLILQIASPVADGQSVSVTNPDGTLWPSSMQFAITANPLRYSPAIHVNQEGYASTWPKKAMVGYYLGTLGEMNLPTLTFAIVDASSGASVYQGTLVVRPDVGYTYSPTPYQKVYEADFSAFTTPGEYELEVPGLGTSLPFLIDDGIAMGFARTYALGLYHQRCGTSNALPFTRFVHSACHTAPASVPLPASSYAFTWNTIAGYANQINSDNAVQTAPTLTGPSAQLFPFLNQGTIDVSGGHHDAGDYSKYTPDSADLIHDLMFAVDSIPGVAALDNLGIPESGDGISDVLQEAKWEADFIAKMQDADGGFYYLVYPQNTEYEDTLPQNGSPQVLWPKNTAATAAAVAALAETASSPAFKKQYPAAAALYLQKATLGWQFLTNAIAKYGKNGAYQKIAHFGDYFADNDELAWAACEMFLATGNTTYQTTLESWYDPSNSSTWFWGWWHCFECYGNAARDYAFAVKSGRLLASQIDPAYLAKCQAEVAAAGDAALLWSQHNAYGTAFPDATKGVMAAGWYFSGAQTFDLTAAYQLNPKPGYLDAIVRGLNYEAGCNPVNVTYLTGLGLRRQKVIVNQYALNARQFLPPDGMPLGAIQMGPVYLPGYGTELSELCFPSDSGSSPTPFYDRWTDTWNVTTEMTHIDQARSLASAAFLASMTSYKTQAWTYSTGQITGLPATVPGGTPVTASLQATGMNLSGARIVWDAIGGQVGYGSTFTFTPTAAGTQWVEAEAEWPDGRRVFAVNELLFATNGQPTVSVVATDSTATLGSTTDTATWTFTRAGDTSTALDVNFNLGGTAAKWTDYYQPSTGGMAQTITFPAGAASTTLTVMARANSTGAIPETVVLTVVASSSYNAGTPSSATVTINQH